MPLIFCNCNLIKRQAPLRAIVDYCPQPGPSSQGIYHNFPVKEQKTVNQKALLLQPARIKTHAKIVIICPFLPTFFPKLIDHKNEKDKTDSHFYSLMLAGRSSETNTLTYFADPLV